MLTLKNVGVQFADKKVFGGLDWILQRGSRVAIVGVNGAGKSTLLKVLTQTNAPTEGTIKVGHQVQIGYYSQLQAESLNQDNTIIEELEATAPHLTISQVRGVAGAFLFTGDAIFKRIKVLSGGEKARVALAKLLLLPNNFLLLDEPTNHLDSESRQVLLEALMNYQGTLCLVSHDRDFVGPLVDQLLEIQNQKVIPLVLNYEEYLAKKVQETRDRLKSPQRDSGSMQAHPQAQPGDAKPASGKPSNNQLRNWKSELQKLETEISKLEKRLDEINHTLSVEDFSARALDLRKLIDEQTQNQTTLDAKMHRWEELCVLLA